MALISFVKLVVLKILDNLASRQNPLSGNNCGRKQNFETVQRDFTFILNVLSESSIQFVWFSIVLT